MTIRHCSKHKNLSVAWEDEGTYEDNPPPSKCPVCSWEERGGTVTPEGKVVTLIEEVAADG